MSRQTDRQTTGKQAKHTALRELTKVSVEGGVCRRKGRRRAKRADFRADRGSNRCFPRYSGTSQAGKYALAILIFIPAFASRLTPSSCILSQLLLERYIYIRQNHAPPPMRPLRFPAEEGVHSLNRGCAKGNHHCKQARSPKAPVAEKHSADSLALAHLSSSPFAVGITTTFL